MLSLGWSGDSGGASMTALLSPAPDSGCGVGGALRDSESLSELCLSHSTLKAGWGWVGIVVGGFGRVSWDDLGNYLSLL